MTTKIITFTVRVADALHLYRLASRLAAVAYDREIAKLPRDGGVPTISRAEILRRNGGAL